MSFEDNAMQARRGANESAATFKWLVALLGLNGNDEAEPVPCAWSEVRAAMRCLSTSGPMILQSVDWVSDFWLARGAVRVPQLHLFPQFAPIWMPPENITHWPTFDAEDVAGLFPHGAHQSNHDAFLEMVSAAHEPTETDDSARDALTRYLELKISNRATACSTFRPSRLSTFVHGWAPPSATCSCLLCLSLSPNRSF